MALIIGLTGGIGCGKSTAAEMFAELGVTIIDTDQISHALTAPGSMAFTQIVSEFGDAYIRGDGGLDRQKLRGKIFSDDQAKSRLEAILHPLIKKEVVKLLDENNGPYVIIVVPLLFETGDYDDVVQRVVVVDCTEQEQIERTVQRSGLSAQQVLAIIQTQVSRAERLSRATDILINSADTSKLREQVTALHAKYLAKAQGV